jgi:tungstate transport system ATP-binding protein
VERALNCIYQLKNVIQRHAGEMALNLPELSVEPGEILGIMGPNGSGKSTLLRLLALLESPDEGEVWFDGRRALPDDIHARRQISLLLQNAYLLSRSVRDNVAYGIKLRGIADEARINAALKSVGLAPDVFARRSAAKLSGGEARRVAMAARLVIEPRVLLLDEPTAGIDEASLENIRLAVLSAQQRGATLIIASHDELWLKNIATRSVLLRNGRIIHS